MTAATGRTRGARRLPRRPAGKSTRSRQRGKRDDDDDWPSSEWDKLSDEQYWAELSADKPLSTMARPPSRPASNAVAVGAPANGSATAKPAARDPRPARPPAPEERRDLPSRKERSDQWEPATERLPIRAARQAAPPVPPARREADILAAEGRSYPEPRPALDLGLARRSTPGRTRHGIPGLMRRGTPARSPGSIPGGGTPPGLSPRGTATGPPPTGLASAPPPIPARSRTTR